MLCRKYTGLVSRNIAGNVKAESSAVSQLVVMQRILYYYMHLICDYKVNLKKKQDVLFEKIIKQRSEF